MAISDYENSNVIPYPAWGFTQVFSAANTWTSIFANTPVSIPQFLPTGCPNNVKTIIILNLMASSSIVLFVGTYADFNNGGVSTSLIGAGKINIPANSSLTLDIGVEGLRTQIGNGSVAGLGNDKLNFFMSTPGVPGATPQVGVTLITTRGFLGAGA
jgi:hypothetical protein